MTKSAKEVANEILATALVCVAGDCDPSPEYSTEVLKIEIMTALTQLTEQRDAAEAKLKEAVSALDEIAMSTRFDQAEGPELRAQVANAARISFYTLTKIRGM